MIFAGALLILLLFAIVIPARAQSASPHETLNQHISDLQKNPDDTALREKIIKLALEMKPSPKVPEEVDELVGQATYIFKTAKSEADFAEAAKAYQKVLLIAPWVPDYYFNLGTVQEKAGKPADAVASFKLYLLAAPNAEDAKSVRQRIGVLKYEAQKETEAAAAQAEKERQEEEARQARITAAEQERRAKAEMLSKIDLSGIWLSSVPQFNFKGCHYEFDIHGDELLMYLTFEKAGTYNKGAIVGGGDQWVHVDAGGRWVDFTFHLGGPDYHTIFDSSLAEGSISADNDRVYFRFTSGVVWNLARQRK
jgi:tetratricopeptide (TPR) repeat protein